MPEFHKPMIADPVAENLRRVYGAPCDDISGDEAANDRLAALMGELGRRHQPRPQGDGAVRPVRYAREPGCATTTGGADRAPPLKSDRAPPLKSRAR